VTAVCVGRLNPWKGQQDLISAAGILRDTGTNLQVQLIGDVFPGQEPVRDQLQAQVKELGLEKQVTFMGELDAPEDVVEQADVAVFPSTSPEPFGMALVEAMALGRPVIATDIGGPAEIVRPGTDGYLVAPHAPRAIADAISGMLAAPEAARAMGEAAVARAKDFSLDDMARSVERLMGGGEADVNHHEAHKVALDQQS
jgi:glycosyltransferase involved in cell wall biosynthesis